MYADGTSGRKPNVPLETSVRANVSLFSTYSSRMSSRSIASARRRGSAAAATTRRGSAAWYALRDAAHDSGTVRRGLVSRRTAARRPRLGGVRRPPGAPAGRARGRRADAAARRRRRRARRRDLAPPRARGRRRGPARPPHALHEPDARTADRRRPRRAGPARGRLARRARRLADALLRRRLVHGSRCRDRVRRARLRRLHAARDAAAVPPGRRGVGRARRAGPDRARRATLCAVPTSHGAGDLARALARPGLLRGSTRTSTTPISSSRAGGR